MQSHNCQNYISKKPIYCTRPDYIILSPQWDYADSFEGEFTYVRKGKDRFYMDHNGNMLPIHYESTINMSTDKGLDFLQRMYFKSVYPVKAAIENEINRLSSQG